MMICLWKTFDQSDVRFLALDVSTNPSVLWKQSSSSPLFSVCIPGSHRDAEHQFWGARPQSSIPTTPSQSLQALLRVPGQVLWIPLWRQCMWGLQGKILIPPPVQNERHSRYETLKEFSLLPFTFLHLFFYLHQPRWCFHLNLHRFGWHLLYYWMWID